MIVSNPLVLLFLVLFSLSSCVLGDEGIEHSPYESAYFGEAGTVGVADGLSPVSVVVYGDVGATLTLIVQSAEFVSSTSEASRTEKTIQISNGDGGGQGMATVEIVSETPGLATLSFKLAPVLEPLEVAFSPVTVAVGAAVPVEFRPGAIAHEVCVYANTSHGTLTVATDSGDLIPEQTSLNEAAAQLRCSDGPEQWAGVALLEWTSREESAEFEVRYTGAGESSTTVQQIPVRGDIFPGYDVVLLDVERTGTWTRMKVELTYRETLSLPFGPASAVSMGGLRSVPAGLVLVGSSSGSEAIVPQTDSGGRVTLYFENRESDVPISVFATPLGGGTLFLGEIPGPPESM